METRTASRGLRRLLVVAAMLFLSACSNNSEMLELQNFVQSAVNRPPGQIEPIPEFRSYEAFTYSAASLRSPFEIPVDISTIIRNQSSDVRPDENRPREQLENYAIGNLSMVGTISKAGVDWALIQDETGLVSRVTLGNYMGRNHGRIISITESQVDLVEIVPTGNGGWIERPQTLTLTQ